MSVYILYALSRENYHENTLARSTASSAGDIYLQHN